MPNPDDFDPAQAIQGARQQQAAEEAEKRRVQTQEDSYRANILKLLRYADEQLENMRNPIVSEFVIIEKWQTQESKQISDKREPKAFKKTLRAGQTVASYKGVTKLFRPTRFIYTVVTRHEHKRRTSYYGSWLSLSSTWSSHVPGCDYNSNDVSRSGLVKLRQPRAGYAYVRVCGGAGDWGPRKVGSINMLFDSNGRERSPTAKFLIFTSLEGALKSSRSDVIPSTKTIGGRSDIERLTTAVTQALDFVAKDRPPEPKWIEPLESYWDW